MKSKDGLVSKVLKFRPSYDQEGKRYLPYCDFGYHMGMIKKEEVCIARKCEHYHRFYISKKSQITL